jgi:hypothetical protein
MSTRIQSAVLAGLVLAAHPGGEALEAQQPPPRTQLPSSGTPTTSGPGGDQRGYTFSNQDPTYLSFLDQSDRPRNSIVEGWILDPDGEPLKGAKVVVTGLDDTLTEKTKTKRGGYFRFEMPLRGGRRWTNLHNHSREPLDLAVETKSGDSIAVKVYLTELVRVTLASRPEDRVHALLTGKVAAESGEPIEGASVTIVDPLDPDFRRQVESDEEGRYSVLLIDAPANAQVIVSEPGGSELETPLELDAMDSLHLVGVGEKDFELATRASPPSSSP